MIQICILKCDGACDISHARFFGESELTRINRIKNARHMRESLGSLVSLKRLVGECPDYDTTISRDENGKPHFTDEKANDFSLSHSYPYSAAALCDGRADIGLDIEVIDESFAYSRVVKRYFTDSEKAQLERSGDSPESFYRIWTAKEARAKLDGRGLLAISSTENADAFLWQGVIRINDVRIAISVCSNNAQDTVRIECEEDYEIQN